MVEITRKARFPWGLTAAAGVSLAILLSLGVWQTQRLGWKENLIARSELAATAPPTALANIADDADPEFRRVMLVCPGLETAPYVELHSIENGTPGVRLISSCRPEGAVQTYLVDRGFVAQEISSRPPVAPSTMPVVVMGQLRHAPTATFAPPPSEGHFYGRDTAAMAQRLAVSGPVSDLTVYALTSSNPQWGALHPSAPPVAFSNNHLGYALTWFGLAMALVAFYIALLRRRSPKAKP